MRILQLIESLEFGGAEKVVIDLANEMSSRHQVTICCVKRLGDLNRDVDSRVRVLCLNKGEGNDYRLPWRLARLLIEGEIEVLHTHEWGVFLEGALAGTLAGTRVMIHTAHGPYMAYAPGWRSRLKRGVRHALERWMSRRFARVVTVSDSIQAYVREEIGIATERVRTIHNGIRIGAIGPEHSTRAGVAEFVSVGRLTEVKNQAMAIRALHATGDRHSRLLLVGDGPERASLEAISKELGLGDRVQFLGFRRDVPDLLERSDVFVVSSNHEGISIAVLEAMRAGLPVIGTRVGGMAETVQDGRTGLLVAPGDVTAMAGAMRALIESPRERARLGAEGRRLLESEFSIENMVGRYEEAYAGG